MEVRHIQQPQAGRRSQDQAVDGVEGCICSPQKWLPQFRPRTSDMVINTELAGFAHPCLPRLTEDCLLDEESTCPGEQIFEKMTAGLYLGELLRQIMLRWACRRSFVNSTCYLSLPCSGADSPKRQTSSASRLRRLWRHPIRFRPIMCHRPTWTPPLARAPTRGVTCWAVLQQAPLSAMQDWFASRRCCRTLWAMTMCHIKKPLWCEQGATTECAGGCQPAGVFQAGGACAAESVQPMRGLACATADHAGSTTVWRCRR